MIAGRALSAVGIGRGGGGGAALGAGAATVGPATVGLARLGLATLGPATLGAATGGAAIVGTDGGSFGASGVDIGSAARLVSSCHGQRISCGVGELTDRGGSDVPLPSDGDESGRGTVESTGRRGADRSTELGPAQTGGPGTAN